MKDWLTKEIEKAQERYNIQGLIILNAYDVYNLLVGALEGGSKYWYLIQEESCEAIDKATEAIKNEPFVDRLLLAVQRGVPVDVHEYESEEKLGTLTSESWAKAEKLMLENHRSHLGDILKENDDAITADVWFQLAVMGEVIYG